ncbi:amino acid transporter [Plasmodium brasilianum]|uniref:Amino acid transporter n=1 Tax=Plasmodium brasilianum TaxID=5824 RepID=A0ACB9YAX5_PLABR|nr:amino acid transporter [Plasmodium brasilianum]
MFKSDKRLVWNEENMNTDKKDECVVPLEDLHTTEWGKTPNKANEKDAVNAYFEQQMKGTNVDKSKSCSLYSNKSIKRLCSEEIEIFFKKALKNEIINFNQKRIDNRDRWNSLYQFICSCLGASLATQCYLDLPELTSGLDYILLLLLVLFCYIFIGLPLVQIEYALGQVSQSCIVNSLSFLKKKYRGIAIISLIVSFHVLTKNINTSIDTAIIIAGSLKKPLSWNMRDCEGILHRMNCIKNDKCKWVGVPADKGSGMGDNYSSTHSSSYSSQHSYSNYSGNNDKHVFLQNFEGKTSISGKQCVSAGISEGQKRVQLAIEGNNMINAKFYNTIFFSEDNFLYLNFPLIAQIFSIVLLSLNCSTGINYMFSSYTNIGTNILISAWYVIFGSCISTIIHFAYYYLCLDLSTNFASVNENKVMVNHLLNDVYRIVFPISSSSSSVDFLILKKNKYFLISHSIYIVALSRVKFSNIMSFAYFLSCTCVLLTTCAIHLKGVVMILKESLSRSSSIQRSFHNTQIQEKDHPEQVHMVPFIRMPNLRTSKGKNRESQHGGSVEQWGAYIKSHWGEKKNNPNLHDHGQVTKFTLMIGSDEDVKKGVHTTVEDKKSKSDYFFKCSMQFVVTVLLLLLTFVVSLISFLYPGKISIFICPPTNMWKISDIHLKKQKPLNCLYTRRIFFFEEILPIEKIMPVYVWRHIEKHINRENFISSLQRENENNETIHDKTYTYLSKNEFENYIFDLIARGSNLCDFTDRQRGP